MCQAYLKDANLNYFRKDRRISSVRGLHAVSLFSEGKFDEAINIFLELDINPAKVVSLYPDSIAGRLAKPRDQWITLFGGEVSPDSTPSVDGEEQTGNRTGTISDDSGRVVPSPDVVTTVPSVEETRTSATGK